MGINWDDYKPAVEDCTPCGCCNSLKNQKLEAELTEAKEALRWRLVSDPPEVRQKLASPVPEESDAVLATDGIETHRSYYVSHGKTEGRWVIRVNGMEFLFCPTHWMPIPPQPAESEVQDE